MASGDSLTKEQHHELCASNWGNQCNCPEHECRCGCRSGGCGRPDGCRCDKDCPCQRTSNQVVDARSKEQMRKRPGEPPHCPSCSCGEGPCTHEWIRNADSTGALDYSICTRCGGRGSAANLAPLASNQRVFPEGSIERELEENAAL